ncbi:MAG: hypothetical protein AABZ53_16910 [Planctomycetota bacterium]
MRKAPLAVGIVLGLGTVSLLAGVLKHPGPVSLSHDLAANSSGPAIIACSVSGGCTVAQSHDAVARSPIGAAHLASAQAPAFAPAPAPFELVLTDKLPPNEYITLPGHDTPMPRYRAQKYFCAADFNRDDIIDDKDITDYLETSATMAGPLAEFLDINHDGSVDASDLQALVDASSTNCDPAQTAVNRSIICLADQEDQEAFARVIFFNDDGC